MRAHRVGGRLLCLAQALTQRGFLYRLDLSVHGLYGDHVSCALCDSAHQRLDRAMGRRAARSRTENRAPAPSLQGVRFAALCSTRPAKMTLESTKDTSQLDKALLQNSSQSRRSLFQIPEGVTYLNCANMAPQLRSITAMGIDAVRAKATPWTIPFSQWFSHPEELRSLAAQVMGADADGVARIPSVSYGIATAAANLPITSGQSSIILDREVPSNGYARRELARKTIVRLITAVRERAQSCTVA